MKIEFSRQIFENYSDIKFYGNHPMGTELFCADEQTGRHDKANSGFLKFCRCS